MISPTPAESQKAGGRVRRLLLLSAVVVATLLLVLCRVPSEYSLSDGCEPDGVLTSVRGSAQGRRFWSSQLQRLDGEVSRLESEPKESARVRAATSAVIQESQRMIDSLHASYPELRPSPASAAAAAFRARADSIETAELQSFLEEYRLKRIATLRHCRSIVVQRATTP